MRNLHNNDNLPKPLIGTIEGQYQLINECQRRQRNSIMNRQMIINQAHTSNGNEQTLHRIKDKMLDRRGGKDGLSETKDRNEGRKVDGMNGGRQNNRWHGKSNLTARWFDGRRIIKEQEQDVRRLAFLGQRNYKFIEAEEGSRILCVVRMEI